MFSFGSTQNDSSNTNGFSFSFGDTSNSTTGGSQFSLLNTNNNAASNTSTETTTTTNNDNNGFSGFSFGAPSSFSFTSPTFGTEVKTDDKVESKAPLFSFGSSSTTSNGQNSNSTATAATNTNNTSTSTTETFSFGNISTVPFSSSSSSAPTSSFSFEISKTNPQQETKNTETNSSIPSQPLFSFGSTSTDTSNQTTAPSQPLFSFGSKPLVSNSTNFTFVPPTSQLSSSSAASESKTHQSSATSHKRKSFIQEEEEDTTEKPKENKKESAKKSKKARMEKEKSSSVQLEQSSSATEAAQQQIEIPPTISFPTTEYTNQTKEKIEKIDVPSVPVTSLKNSKFTASDNPRSLPSLLWRQIYESRTNFVDCNQTTELDILLDIQKLYGVILHMSADAEQNPFFSEAQIYELCCMMFIQANGNITPLLSNWAQRYLLPSSPLKDETHEICWELVYEWALQANFAKILEYLKPYFDTKTETDFSIYTNFQKLLENAPQISPTEEMKLHEIELANWKEDCKACADALSVEDEQGRRLLLLLSGDISQVDSIPTIHWLYKFVGDLFFNVPRCSREQLEKYIPIIPNVNQLPIVDKIILLVLMQEPIEAILEACATLFHPWLSCHLSDLLYRWRRINNNTRVTYIKKYTEHLPSENWDVCLDYLFYCNEESVKQNIDICLQNVSLESEQKLSKVVSALQRYERLSLRPYSTMKRIKWGEYRKNTMKRFMEQEKIQQNASLVVKYCLLSDDFTQLSKVLDKVAEKYIADSYSSVEHRSVFTLASQLESIASLALSFDFKLDGKEVSDKTICIQKIQFFLEYLRLLASLETNNWKNAAERLIYLLNNNSTSSDALAVVVSEQHEIQTPKRFWIILLMLAVPLLQQSTPIFDESQTYLMMNCLELIASSHKSTVYLKFVSAEDLGVIRKALTSNLTRCMFLQASTLNQQKFSLKNK